MLLYFRLLKTGMLDLTDADPEALQDLLIGETVTTSRLLGDRDDAAAAGKLLEIRRRSQANAEEKGLATLFIALGLATWRAPDGGRDPEAPVLLMPIEVQPRGREGRSFALKRNGDVQVNLVLIQELEASFGCTVAPETIVNGNGAAGEAFEPGQAFRRLEDRAGDLHGFAVRNKVVVGNFAFQKMAMVRDLQECADALAEHDLIAALAGDSAARESVLRARTEVDAEDLDRTPPDREFLVLDADSSQQRVIAAVLADQDGVIHGPPGTGKSQTIVNLVSELAAHGRRTLFVAEKRAALEVVARRLNDVDLGHMLLDLHGADVSRREVMKRIADCLALVPETMAVDATALHQRFVDRRASLNEHSSRLHKQRPPAALSAFDIQSELLQLGLQVTSTTRWRGAALADMTAEAVRGIELLLTEFGGFESLVLSTSSSPWGRSAVHDAATAQQALDLVAELHSSIWPALTDCLADVLRETGLEEPRSVRDTAELGQLLSGVGTTLAWYSADLYRLEELPTLALDLQPGLNGGVAALWAWCTSGRYRAAQSKAKSLRSSASSAGIAREIQAAVKERNEWLARGGSDSGPRSCGESLERLQSILAQAQSALEKLERLVGLRDLADRSIIDLAEFISALAADTGTLFRLPRKAELERLLQASHLGPFLDELRKRRVPASQWLAAFRHSWLTSMLDGIRLQDSALAGFDGQAHQRIVEEFHELDRQRLQIAVHRVQRVHAERVIAAMNDYPAQASLVRHESAKRARHMPLRKLLAQAPDVLTALFPCWMASPLAVSQLIGSDKRYFDVVLFDEASQVLPEDAAAALLRARRAVVAGDRNQLPPTMFFAAGDDELTDTDDDPAPTAGFESLLDIMSGLVEQWPLDWHYRSKDERLIAFANAHVYGNRLVTFPSANEAPAISHVLVTPTSLMDGQGESPSDEVSRVVDLVLQHAAERPHESLGVITLGIKHANRIQAAIDQARLIRSDLDEFFDEHAGERFFVKNLERVQGDERDSVILSVGVGKLRTGVVDYRGFGPLNGEGGHRRLNVAITRARRRMTVVSAFTHFDMDPQRGGGTGMLRDYLQYASSGGASFGDGHQSGTLLNAFETDITETLQAEGIPVVPQWGASKYRIDLVARHPERPGQFVLAIECDGASYHAAPTARDRDRLRQQHLESLGWRFHRIWSTDWFQHRDDEVKRVKAAYAAAVEVADGPSRIARASAPAAHAQLQDLAVKTPAQTRGPKPFLIQRQPIDDYTLRELRSLLTWIVSDGRLRTNDELVEELVNELGYSRRGGRIMQRLQHLVRSV